MVLLQSLLNFILPRKCLYCGSSQQTTQINLCTDCQLHLPYCQQSIPVAYLDSCHAAFYYQSPVREWLHQYKFKAGFAAGKLLSDLLRQSLIGKNKIMADYIIAVPLHRHRLRQRGFNQSLSLAKNVAAYYQIPLLKKSLIKTKKTAIQHQLSRQQRFDNLTNAFAIPNPAMIKDKNIILVDDVITTGQTLQTIAQLLKKHGAGKISAFAICYRPLV